MPTAADLNRPRKGDTMRNVRFILAALAAALVALVAAPLVASAHSGNVVASETCTSFTVVVSLDHNVTADRTVDVTTTIPGTTGFTGHHYDTSFGTILTLHGPAPASGTVTLSIFNGSQLEFTASGSVHPSEDCPTPTPTPTPSLTPTPSPTPTPAVPVAAVTPPTPSTGADLPIAGGGLLLVIAGGALLVARRRGETP
jgi:hypothetical protein